ncbi:hypothetical protein KHP62_15530 [Rhodobacteraceae bacterium NNCM2]|nr:hypothetical protein [Coraliihabitans acroporae]
MRKTLSIAAIALAGAFPANAADEAVYLLKSAGDLGTLCGAPNDPSAIHMCEGFLVGVHRMHLAVSEATGNKLYCIPEDGSVTRDTAAAGFAVWVSGNSEVAGLEPAEAVLTWAKASYPCN